MQKLRLLIRKLAYKENASSETLIKYLREHGAKIGDDVIIYALNKTLIDKTTPWLLSIGNHVRIAEGVKILTHDGSWLTLKTNTVDSLESGAIFGALGHVDIGNNVFIGINAIVTRGVTIGDNVIIGAGSVVSKDCEPNSVYAGVPAKRIMSFEEFYQKRKDAQFNEAKNIAVRYKKVFGVEPDRSIFNEYFMLFATKDEAEQVPEFKRQMHASDSYDLTVSYMASNEPTFKSFEDFLDACYDRSK